MIAEKTKVVVIVGPTASGKTSLSIEIAKQFNGEVISADSRQVYKKLDIGTEKVTKEEMGGVPHHLLDVVDVETIYNASDYRDAGKKAIKEITERGRLPIIAGGTFFYIDTLLGRIIAPEVAPNPELRSHLSEMSTQMLYDELERVDPERALTIDKDNKRRLIRALEIVHKLGKVPSNKDIRPTCTYDVLTIGIETDRVELRAHIRARAADALTKGLVEETKELLESGVTRERLSEIGLEYRVIMEYMDGDLTDEQLIKKLEEKNWQYAKRQLTWLKHDKTINWVKRENIEDIFTLIENFLS